MIAPMAAATWMRATSGFGMATSFRWLAMSIAWQAIYFNDETQYTSGSMQCRA